MKIFNYSTNTIDKILKDFSVNPQVGLNINSVAKRQLEFGLNNLVFKKLNAWRVFFRQFKSSFIYLLLGAMAITIFLGQVVDTLMILTFLAVNVGLGFFQEYRSEKTIELLNKFALPRTKVLRNGKIEQTVSEKLVPGDIIFLETGDKVPADVRFIELNNLMIDETILTGESLSVYKNIDVLKHCPSAYHEALNLGFSGTDVLSGKAKAIVLATGKNTAFGEITKLATESWKVSDFERSISRFSTFIIELVGLTLVIVFLANIFIKKGDIDILELIIFSVALTVSVIPEALPLVTTFSLTQSARRLSKNKVIIKHLSAIKDIGGIEILCSDKTGTLTKNELKVANVHSDNPNQILFLANIASNLTLKKKVEPFDIALERELTTKQKKQIQKVVKIAEEPFNPKIKRNTVLAKVARKNLLITRGAPESIFNLCTKLDDTFKKNANDWIAREGEQGHRVLAVAFKEEKRISKNYNTSEILESDNFVFLGIISFVDPIKPCSFQIVSRAKELGVNIKVITGDSLEVAGAVGHSIGLIDSPKKVMSGEKWEKMTTAKQQVCLDKYLVFARVSPEQKYKIVQSLQSRYAVGFLGEGINDTPALKIASVSLVVDSAADIAREAADVVLMKKNLNVILDGIIEGRVAFANSAKYIKSTLASNFGNFFAVASASLMIDFLPMLPIQILLVNLLTDTPMISVSSDSVDKDELTSPKKYEVKDIIILAIILGVISTMFDFILFGMFFRTSPEILQTNWFIGSILTELALIFSIRTRSFFLKGSAPSRPLVWLSIMIIIVTIGLPFTFIGQNIFHFVAPSNSHLLQILSLVGTYFMCSEIVKLLYYKSKIKNGKILV